jgi:hypothetical protein
MQFQPDEEKAMAMVQRFCASKLVTLSLLTATFLATAHEVNAQPFSFPGDHHRGANGAGNAA